MSERLSSELKWCPRNPSPLALVDAGAGGGAPRLVKSSTEVKVILVVRASPKPSSPDQVALVNGPPVGSPLALALNGFWKVRISVPVPP